MRRALDALKRGQSAVFDVARWPWLLELAQEADADIEITTLKFRLKKDGGEFKSAIWRNLRTSTIGQ